MILFDLQCEAADHVFEAWFASSAAFDDQKAKGLLLCPLCGDTSVNKALMAPNIGSKANQRSGTSLATIPNPSNGEGAGSELRAMLGKIASLQAEALADSKWVGKDFEHQARAMDAGEIRHGPIHGQATPEQARELMADGIAVMPLLIPIIPPDEQN